MRVRAQILELLRTSGIDRLVHDLPDAPAHWGDMAQHMFWGALYHWFVLTGFWDYRNFRPHRALTVGQEFLLYLRRFLLMPLHRVERLAATWRIHGIDPALLASETGSA